MRVRHFLALTFLLAALLLQAQSRPDTIDYSLNARYSPGSGSFAPFLRTANQYDKENVCKWEKAAFLAVGGCQTGAFSEEHQSQSRIVGRPGRYVWE